MFLPPPATAAPSYLWVRNFGANPASPSSGTTISLFDKTMLLSNQHEDGSIYLRAFSALDEGDITIAPAVQRGLLWVDKAVVPRLVPGLTQQASFFAALSNAGQLDAPLCRPKTGAFFVHEVAYAANGSLSKLAVDFSGACTLGYIANITGALRFNSTLPSNQDTVYAVAPPDRAVTEGDKVVLDGSLSWNPSSRIRQLLWTQLSGPPLDLTDCNLGICKTYAPLVQPGGGTAVLQLTATSASGQTAQARMQLNIRSWHDRQSRMDLYGQGYVAGGADLHLTEMDGPFTVPVKDGTEAVYPDQTVERIQVKFWGGGSYGAPSDGDPRLVLSNSLGKPLVPGRYTGAASRSLASRLRPCRHSI